jgi:hypothetical protein
MVKFVKKVNGNKYFDTAVVLILVCGKFVMDLHGDLK